VNSKRLVHFVQIGALGAEDWVEEELEEAEEGTEHKEEDRLANQQV
jgi:hypothetical protein